MGGATGGVGKAGGAKARPWIYAKLEGNLMTRRNKAGKIEYCIGRNKNTIADSPKKARALYAKLKGAKKGVTYAFGAAKIKGKKSKPLTAKQKAARKAVAQRVVEEFGGMPQLLRGKAKKGTVK